MTKRFDDVLFLAFKAGMRMGTAVEPIPTWARIEFEQWRKTLPSPTPGKVDDDGR